MDLRTQATTKIVWEYPAKNTSLLIYQVRAEPFYIHARAKTRPRDFCNHYIWICVRNVTQRADGSWFYDSMYESTSTIDHLNLTKGRTRPSRSPFASLVEERLRFCVDYRALNADMHVHTKSISDHLDPSLKPSTVSSKGTIMSWRPKNPTLGPTYTEFMKVE